MAVVSDSVQGPELGQDWFELGSKEVQSSWTVASEGY